MNHICLFPKRSRDYALASIDIFAEVDLANHLFAQTYRSQLLRSENMASLVKLWGAAYQWQSWMNLPYTIRTGRPALEAAYGEETTIWTYLEQHPEEATTFQQGLMVNANLIIPSLLDSYNFTSLRALVDVGGGYGGLCHALLAAYPDLHVTLFDREEVIEQVRAQGLSQDLRDRYELQAGNFFQKLPPHRDCYLFKNVLMDWSDDDYVHILRKCASVMEPGSRVLIIEPVLAGSETPFTAFFSLQMAMMMRQAHHRTLEEHQDLASKAGLVLTRAKPLGLEQMVIELRLNTVAEGGAQS
jgi:precorrin-6B methylase 2